MHGRGIQEPVTRMGMGIRIAGVPAAVVPALKEVILDLDPAKPLQTE